MGYVAPTWQNGGPPALNAKNMQDISDNLAYVSNHMVNPNLLDNWYFGNPVNQRGQTSYTQLGYTFDRWMMEGHPFYVDKSANYGGSIHLVMGSEPQTFMQKIETMPQQQMTASILLGGASAGGYFLVQSWPDAADSHMVPIQSEMTTFTFTPAQSGMYRIAIFNGDKTPDIFVRAVGLEPGSQQTVAHKEYGEWVLNEIPKFGDQLAECQRYQFINRGIQYSSIGSGFVDASGTKAKITAPISSMRTIPTIQFVGGIGITQPNGLSGAIQNPSILSWGQGCVVFEADCTGFTPNSPVFCYSDPNSYVIFDANL